MLSQLRDIIGTQNGASGRAIATNWGNLIPQPSVCYTSSLQFYVNGARFPPKAARTGLQRIDAGSGMLLAALI